VEISLTKEREEEERQKELHRRKLEQRQFESDKKATLEKQKEAELREVLRKKEENDDLKPAYSRNNPFLPDLFGNDILKPLPASSMKDSE